MKNNKIISVIMGGVMAVSGTSVCLVGCGGDNWYDSEMLNALAANLALNLMGNDTYSWNVLSVDPYNSYGYTPYYEPSWYSYGGRLTAADAQSLVAALNSYNAELKKYDYDFLSKADAITYRSMEYTLTTYLNYYKSQYAPDFDLIGGSYISTQGGYVANFADMCENYAFRNEDDVKDLLKMTRSTEAAFKTYLNYAEDRVKAGYPLYDFTLNGMQDYLNDIVEQGSEYYLFEFMDTKLQNADFLTAAQKSEYAEKYNEALSQNFMSGVSALASGLDDYKGNVEQAEMSYLGAYGAVGRAYYEWKFKNLTGLFNANMLSVYLEMASTYSDYLQKYWDISEKAEALGDSAAPEDKAVYEQFNAYKSGEKLLLDLSEPQETLDYLKIAAKKIVPDLDVMPEIDFKYMDDSVAQITTTLAYYLLSPLDEMGSAEHITINAYSMESDKSAFLTTLAHEGYPGHLYAHVKSKENELNLLTGMNYCTAFAEGWANYAELILLKNIAEESTDKAVKLFCEYKCYDILTGYISMALHDMNINYYGYTVADFVDMGMSNDDATDFLQMMSEIPVVYIPYGYGMQKMVDYHEQAQTALGSKYSEVAFNDMLLSEGDGPTLARVQEIAKEYVNKNK